MLGTLVFITGTDYAHTDITNQAVSHTNHSLYHYISKQLERISQSKSH